MSGVESSNPETRYHDQENANCPRTEEGTSTAEQFGSFEVLAAMVLVEGIERERKPSPTSANTKLSISGAPPARATRSRCCRSELLFIVIKVALEMPAYILNLGRLRENFV